ncbi:DgyrCDS8738 [Dimorphilus gyrociliatus]|uniref:DgyrCDS8738 n=1 Tax=Dimorphilus gyrociliatus TaxID=2664684 RepID=A0A7I8VUZ3_9ANNE|nr:DgyrCDS8738 [Dimorphilus gyrociliatus]
MQNFIILFALLSPLLGEDRKEVLLKAQCRANCVSLLLDNRKQMQEVAATLRSCVSAPWCASCLKPCSATFENLEKCYGMCQKFEDGCSQSCSYQNEIRRETVNETLLPATPPKPSVYDAFKIIWDDNNVQERREVLVYVVEVASHIGPFFNVGKLSPWRQVLQVSETNGFLPENFIKPGRFYQFRVTAVSKYGSSSSSIPSAPIRSLREAKAPSKPVNIKLNITGDNTATVSWDPPVNTDLPINRYKIYWGSLSYSSSGKRIKRLHEKKILASSVRQYELINLEKRKIYYIELKAISKLGRKKLKGDRIFIDFEIGNEKKSSQVPQVIRPLPVSNLTAHAPKMMHHGALVNLTWNTKDLDNFFAVSWRRKVCLNDSSGKIDTIKKDTTKNTTYTLSRLKFACTYEIHVRAIDGRANLSSSPIILKIFIPSCEELQEKLNLPANACPTTSSLPEPPRNLVHRIKVTQRHNITSKLSWDHPHSDTPILQYRIRWGPTLENEYVPTFDKYFDKLKFLEGSKNKFTLTELKENREYLVLIRALSKAGPGKESTLTFKTPDLHKQIDLRKPRHKHKRKKKRRKENAGVPYRIPMNKNFSTPTIIRNQPWWVKDGGIKSSFHSRLLVNFVWCFSVAVFWLRLPL